jgi:signal transduction histidine kinase
MGLGLYIAKQIVMNFDGNIDFFSKELQGSTFVFSFKVEIGDYDVE